MHYIALFIALVFLPFAAEAQPITLQLDLDVWGNTAALLIGFLVVALLVNILNPAKRSRLRWGILLFVAHLVSALLAQLPEDAGSAWPLRLQVLSRLFGGFTVIRLLAIALFDVLFVRLQLVFSVIAGELLIAAAYISITLLILSNAGVDATGLLTASTVVTAVVGLSLQQTLGHVVGGIALQADSSFEVGDWIQFVPTGSSSAGPKMKITKIRWRHTVAESILQDTVVIPNSLLLSSQFILLGKVDNKKTPRLSLAEITVSLKHSPAEVCRIVEGALARSPLRNVAPSPSPECYCLDMTRQGFTGVAVYGVAFFFYEIPGEMSAASRIRLRASAALKRAKFSLGEPPPTLEEREAEHNEKIRALRNIGIFSSLSEQERSSLALSLVPSPFMEGELITLQGETDRSLYILRRGSAVVQLEKDDAARIVAKLEAPSFFGEMALLTGERRAATVIASTDVECYRLEQEALQDILLARRDLAQDLSLRLVERLSVLQSTFDTVLDEANDPNEKRVLAAKLLKSIQSFFGL